MISKFRIVAVALVSEGVYLRESGYKGDILVLNQPFIDDIDDICSYDLVVGVSDINFFKEVVRLNKSIRVHLEIETGMGRCGINSFDLNSFLDYLKNKHLISVEGVYTHLSSADIDHTYTLRQISIFEDCVRRVKDIFPDIKYIHNSASNGLLNFDLGICNAVRPGMLLYGYPSSKTSLDKIKLYPVASLKSRISFIKNIHEGEAIGYGRSFVSIKDMKIATVSIGYADGVKRELSNTGYVSINKVKCKIVGKICMDSLMVDVSELDDVKVGDTVYIFDNDIVTLDEISFLSKTINYEVLSTVGERVERIFID